MAERHRENQNPYERLDNAQILELLDDSQEKFDEAFERYKGTRSRRDRNRMNVLDRDMRGIEEELEKRGIIPKEKEEDTTDEDDLREYLNENDPETIGKNQLEATNKRLDTYRKVKGPKGIRKNNFTSFDQMWADAQRENQAVDRKREAEAQKAQTEAEVGEEVDKEWEKIELGEKTLEAHKEAAAEGKVEDFDSYDEMYDQAQKDNQDIDKIRDSSDYKAEGALKVTYEIIDREISQREAKAAEFRNRKFLERIRPKNQGDRLRARISERQSRRLQDLRARLGSEVTKYFEEKKGFQSKLDLFSNTGADDFSKMADGSGQQTSQDYKQIMAEMAIMEDNHKRALESIQKQLKWMDVEINYGAGDTSKLDSVDSKTLNTDEQLFMQQETEKMRGDLDFQHSKIDIYAELDKNKKVKMGSELKDILKHTTDTEVAERDKKRQEEAKREIKKVLKEYQQKVLEARLKIERLTKIIESEQKADPAKMNMALVQGAAERIEEESIAIKKYEEQLRRKVKIRAGYKTRFASHARP